MGTPTFSIPTLTSLIDSGENIVAVVTRPDAPKGRGQKVTAPDAKAEAERKGVPVLQPTDANDPGFIKTLRSLNPEIIVVAAYGKILPREIITLPVHGCINLHPSLLPKYRGPSPIQRAVLHGEKKTGVTIMRLNEGMDAGPIVLQKETAIGEDETAEELGARLSSIGAELMVEAVKAIGQGKAVYRDQNEKEASYAPFIKKGEGEIDWSQSAEEIRNRIRGLLPWPGAFTFINGKRIKIIKGKAEKSSGDAAPGTIAGVSPEGIRIATGKGDIVILRLQEEGKKETNAKEFLLGRKISVGTICGRQR